MAYYWPFDCLYNLQEYLGGYFDKTTTHLLTIFGSLGVFGNILNLVVLTRKELRSPLIILVIFLSSYDLAVCLGYMILGLWDTFRTSTNMQEEDFKRSSEWTSTWRYWAYPIAIGYEGSGYMTAAIALERVFVLCNPFSRKVVTERASLAVSLGILGVIILQTIVTSFTNVCGIPDLASRLSLVITFVLPFICSLVCNGIIIWKVVTRKRVGTSRRVGGVGGLRTTNILIAIISINILSLAVYLSSGFFIGVESPGQGQGPGQIPLPELQEDAEYNIFNVTEGPGVGTTPGMPKVDSSLRFLRVAVPFLNVFNCAINVVLYSLFNKAFVTSLKRMSNYENWFRKGSTISETREILLFDS